MTNDERHAKVIEIQSRATAIRKLADERSDAISEGRRLERIHAMADDAVALTVELQSEFDAGDAEPCD